MVEFLPYILILIGWNPAHPEDSMALQHSLHFDEAACIERGRTLTEQRNSASSEAFPARYTYFCIQAPTGQEYDDLFEQRK
ncbi:hypothetical protein M3P36_13760 [Altererythrobacter sp. KTW20L]|uniref:hypothetical protein n=1 Tax=Altererythrobacter sp. KTW20L TaxID=2942210 RepID=UPI0020C1000D|nr:hypothetical protein [Altererythrobacter sp. KTW20L]MCL6252107.1 hypothetical protein [Altererythrobacter sp. KTW20L]